MARCVFIVQGEGRGHMSQSMALKEYLEEAGHAVESAIFVEVRLRSPFPDYFRDFFQGKLNYF